MTHNQLLVNLMAQGARVLLVALVLVLSACDEGTRTSSNLRSGGDAVVVYSARSEYLIEPVFKAFTQDTGIEVRSLTDKAGPLLTRLIAEGATTSADILLTVDAGNLWHATRSGMLRSVDSAVLAQNVPEHLRDTQGHWYGLSMRARVIVYHTERVQATELHDYAGLAEERWHDRLCLRTSKKVYNQSLVAALIQRHGQLRAREIVSGWVDNLALPPFASDTQALEAVIAGNCDVTVVNSYYFARLERDWRAKSKVIPLQIYLPDQDSPGVHVNISGAGITKHAKHPKLALRLLEWLSSEHAQRLFAESNLEYPVNARVSLSPTLEDWGTLNADTMPVSVFGALQARSVVLMDAAAYH